MRKAPVRPLLISPIPATAAGPVSRPMSIKRLARVRVNWFMVGSIFGIGLSFFMNFVITALVMPQYRAFTGGELQVTEVGKPAAAKPVALASAAPASKTETAAKAETAVNVEKPAEKETVVAEAKPTEPEITYPRTVAVKLTRGQTLLDILVANRVQTSEAHAVVDALRARFNPKTLKPGQKISVTLARHETLGDKAAVRELAIKLPNFDTIELQRLDNGRYNVAATKEQVTEKAHRGFGKVRTSFSQAAADANIPNSVMNDIVKAYSYDIDFQREIHPGDTIEVLMDRKTTSDGRVGNHAEPRYAALTLRGKKHEIFRFKTSGGDYAWYDANGNSIKKSLLRTPLNVAHITSGFGMRTHPILGYSKMHRGVDFGAGTGTPIMAAGDGTVVFKGWKNGYGNYVKIKHNNTYETAYGHVSKFGNISVGNRVRQGQVIAYVGMTGAATGPHLHYEVLKNDAQVNPVSKQFTLANGLSGKQLAAFKTYKQTAVKELASLGGTQPSPAKKGKATPTKLASR